MQNEQIHKRGRYSAEFKEKVALEALSGAKTHAQIASDYGISPDLVKDWKKQAKEMLGECFRRGGRKTEMEKKDERIANLERLLGKREFELDWLSKKSQGVGTVCLALSAVNRYLTGCCRQPYYLAFCSADGYAPWAPCRIGLTSSGAR